ncbi:NAD(P)-dependent oxidoreductase [Pseudomaricurvus sp. HS19]|uniref:NAD(P)-dependent oxidoreductase n=1 Tax=Pseudomaricurvus sp. HS19 TaxID=2692626 RepID=UPI00136E81D1|nr:NAD(P)-dependent oxidoreductase [Pseudomaricurvus sp. HS19]MYM62559.1 NAD-binding protein [Pseudomaricurvus sp. HS19]
MQKVTFIGLGVMGFPMAGHLARAGYPVTVFNRSPSKAAEWLAVYSGTSGSTPAAAAAEAEVVITCVGADKDLREVLLGADGAMIHARRGTVFIDHTTASADIAREMRGEALARGCEFIDAPVSGGQQGAERGALTIMAGGDAEAFSAVKELLSVYAREVQLLGPSGSGQLCKMVNQICIAGLLQGLAEGLNFANRAGLDAEQVVAVISQGAAQSWQMQNRYATMLAGQYDHGFAVDWMRKDLSLALQEANNNGAALPVTALVDQFYSDVQRLGGRRWDTSSLLARLQALQYEE